MSESPTATRRAQRAVEAYGRTIRGAVRQFWAGRLDYDQAFEFMMSTISIGLRNNWHAGARECGIQPNELSPAERMALQARIVEEQSHIAPFLTAIENANKQAGAKLGPQLARAKMWTLRATDVQNQARTLACGDKKLKWIWDPVKEHCVDCENLNGKTKRASTWRQSGILPQSQELACKGFLCGCRLEPTNDSLSRGPLPRLRG